MARAHCYRPITDDAGNLVTNIAVRLLEPTSVSLVTVGVYTGPSGSSVYGPTWVATNGIIDFYLAAPKRLRIGVTAPNQPEFFLDNEDIWPPADQILTTPVPFTITNSPEANSTLVVTGSNTAAWAIVPNAARITTSFTTAPLAANGVQTGRVALGVSYHLMQVITDQPSRIRLYTDSDKQSADVTRDIGIDPKGDHGLQFEFVSIASALRLDCAPPVTGTNTESPLTARIPITVTNLSNGIATVQVDLVASRME